MPHFHLLESSHNTYPSLFTNPYSTSLLNKVLIKKSKISKTSIAFIIERGLNFHINSLRGGIS